MALPKGVKSQVDYTKLYMSNELEGEVIDEKNNARTSQGGSDFIDYTKSKNTFKTFTSRGGIAGFVNRRFGLGATKFKKPIVSAKSIGKAALTVTKSNPKTAAAVAVGAAVLPPIINKTREILKKRSDAKIDKEVEKYVSDRQLKGGSKKVEYKPNDQYTVTRDEKGKVTGTGKLIRVQPGTRTIMRMPEPGERTSTKSRFSQHTGSPFKASPLNKNKNIYGLKTEETISEKALSKSQQRFMGMVYAYKKGEMPNASDEVKKAAEGMSKKDAEKYASTKHAKLPEKVEEALNAKDIPVIKKLKDKLEGASKKHENQAKLLAKALKNEETAIESELLIQDWNKDDIKFTEVEAIDIIKPEPLKPSPSNWREDLGEDWQKVNRKDKTDGLSKKAVKAYRRENPGSKLQTAVTKDPKKLKKGSKSAKRRLSFCRRMKGMKKKLTSAKTRRDPDSRINKALRRWNC